ncbi:neutral zinc metallopeptidase [Saccharopolyspora sp. NFXS83]|uniref:neutral zinc metallopeptidase n=1 Tax=Saccharopolyspora sp. NFXS83 TaxID=2993560 RepID=UPI00224AF50C|nr:neutral zinc metallopeptidase [Saccharopolyspora sp. NFXS83]MCX2733971.1 neutral zinc metallopeptidase [Saccharopolyspora sp. NFXS83]
MAPVSAGGRRGERVFGVIFALLTCIVLLGGCSRVVSGTPSVAGGPATDDVAGLPVDDGPTGPRAGVADADLPVEGTDGGEMDVLARNAIADIQEFWKDEFPGSFDGKRFDDVKRLVSYDSTALGGDLCGERTQGLSNAFYCGKENLIAWDRADLLPRLDNSFGPIAVVTVLAHEMGHAVEHRAGTTGADDPTLVLEQQADCFTGAFFRHVAEGDAEHFQVSTGDGLNKVMGVLNYIRDTPGDTDFKGADAHGSAFDRVTAFQYGFSDGPKRCAAMDADDVKQRTTQFQFWKKAQETDLPVDEKNLRAVQDSLQEVFRDTGALPPELVTEPRACDGVRGTAPAAYCPATNTISLSLDDLQKIANPPAKDAPDSGYGDFAAYAQIASRYALSVQQAAGLPLEGENAGLRTACMVGSWSGLLVEDPIGQRNPVGELRMAPGDIDEGVAALLGDDSLIAADVNGDQVPAGFARLDAFRTGFQDGFGPCSTKYGV